VYLKYVFCLNESNKGGSNLSDFTISGSGAEHDKKKSSSNGASKIQRALTLPQTAAGEELRDDNYGYLSMILLIEPSA
jgi:hypothetical protein